MSELYPLLQVANPQLPPPGSGVWVVFTVIKMIVMFTVYMVGAALLTLAERKIAAWIQGRHGPNRVGGKGGWLQPVADGVKNFMKEETYPGAVYKPLFILAPVITFIPALTTMAVIPFGAPLPTPWGRIEMVVADLPIGFLFILAISSLGVYGIVIAGWASNNKYALLGGLRSSAQMISYEISLGMSTIPVLLLAGNVTLSTIVTQQAYGGWNVVNLTIAFLIFLVAAFAETNRLPFDLPEAESELVAGYHTEYSAMKFSLFPISEYCNMITASALMATLFFGGWDVPFTGRDNIGPYSVGLTLLSILIFSLKTAFFLFFYIWVRWTLPRFRYDQLMSLGWKVMLPTALAYVVVVAAAMLILESAGIRRGAMYSSILGALNMALVVILFAFLDRGRLVSPAYGKVQQSRLARLQRVSGRSSLATGAAE